MMELPFGKGALHVRMPAEARVVMPPEVVGLVDPLAAVREALAYPIGTARLAELAAGKRTVTIVINDITRPAPSELLVTELLAELQRGGIGEDAVTLLVATGNHRPNTPDELAGMLGRELAGRLRIVNHDGQDPSQLVQLGVTFRGLPVVINRLAAEADLLILTGIVTPHQTAGYSGGRKSIMPGVAGMRSLQQHHSFPIRSFHPVMGQIADNPFHEEALAAARMARVDFIINVVKNRRGELIAAVAGDLDAAHMEGVRRCAEAWEVQLSDPCDIALVTPGGYPKDIDMHQAQKAVATAERVTRPGGPIILVAECRDGLPSFASALMSCSSPREMVDRFVSTGFTADDHSSKAFMYARAMLEHPLIVVTDGVPPEDLGRMFMSHAPNVEAALDMALRKVADRGGAGPGSPRILVVPHAVDTLLSVARTTSTGKSASPWHAI